MNKTRCLTAIMAVLAVAGVLLCSCSQLTQVKEGTIVAKGKYKSEVVVEKFGKTPAGEPVNLYKLTNANGLRIDITNYGGIVTRFLVPDRNGRLDDIVLGFDKLEDYLKPHPHFGTLVGRYGNRIARGKFTLDGKEYQLTLNEKDKTHLHGGLKGFDKAVWPAEVVKGEHAVGLRLKHFSKDGDQGYPGNLKCTVTYWLTDDDEMKIVYEAETDKATPINLVQHNYYNLAGAGKGTILNHELMINADTITPADEDLIPTGEIYGVAGTPFDFTKPTAIGARINADDKQLKSCKGYDINYVLNSGGGALALAARVHEPATGRTMEIYTTEPGIQFYTGNFLDGSLIGKGGKAYKRNYAFCLETQHFPDSPNKPMFPSAILKPGQKYNHVAVFKFKAE